MLETKSLMYQVTAATNLFCKLKKLNKQTTLKFEINEHAFIMELRETLTQ